MWAFFEKHGMEEKEFFRSFTLEHYNFPLHFHRAYELVYVNEGRLSVTIDDNEYLMHKHDLVFVFPNQLHEFKLVDEDAKISVIQFSPELIGDFYTEYKGLVPSDNVLRLDRDMKLTELDSIYRQKSFLYSICAEITSRKSFSAVKQSPQTKVLHKILLYVEQHYAADCTLKAVAAHLRYDYPYISKLFVQLMKMTFTEYLNHFRISQACYALRTTHQSIGEIATVSGYENLRTFHRNFRKVTDQSPKEYRSSRLHLV